MMNIKVTITEKELHDFLDYGRKLRKDPCIGCPDKAYCCGCLVQKAWIQELESLPIMSAEWDKYEDVRKYTEDILDLEEAISEANKFLRKQAELRDEIIKIRMKFEVIDE